MMSVTVTVSVKNGKRKKRGRWPADLLTVTKAAKKLGVSRGHLSYVLHGHRESRPLLRRYRALLNNGKEKCK
jgi:hypothetical protein